MPAIEAIIDYDSPHIEVAASADPTRIRAPGRRLCAIGSTPASIGLSPIQTAIYAGVGTQPEIFAPKSFHFSRTPMCRDDGVAALQGHVVADGPRAGDGVSGAAERLRACSKRDSSTEP